MCKLVNESRRLRSQCVTAVFAFTHEIRMPVVVAGIKEGANVVDRNSEVIGKIRDT